MELHHYCLGHIFTYQKFVDPKEDSHVYGLAYMAKAGGRSGICSGCFNHYDCTVHILFLRATACNPSRVLDIIEPSVRLSICLSHPGAVGRWVTSGLMSNDPRGQSSALVRPRPVSYPVS